MHPLVVRTNEQLGSRYTPQCWTGSSNFKRWFWFHIKHDFNKSQHLSELWAHRHNIFPAFVNTRITSAMLLKLHISNLLQLYDFKGMGPTSIVPCTCRVLYQYFNTLSKLIFAYSFSAVFQSRRDRKVINDERTLSLHLRTNAVLTIEFVQCLLLLR